MRNVHLEHELGQFLATKILLRNTIHISTLEMQQSHGELFVANPDAFTNLPLTCNAVDHHPLKLEGKNIACLTFMGTSQQTE